MSRRYDVEVININILLRRTYSKRDKVRILINLAYLAFRNAFIYVYSRSCLCRGFFDKIKGTTSRVISLLVVPVSPGLLYRQNIDSRDSGVVEKPDENFISRFINVVL